MNETEIKVVRILKENTGNQAMDDNEVLHQNFRDLGINSLNFIKVVVAIEDEFDVVFEDNQMNYELFGSVKDIVSLISKEA